MKLLILTQIVDANDDVLGFMHGWIAEFAKHCEKVTVVCLKKGEVALPGNVRVYSLGKEKKYTNFKKIRYTLNFYKYIWQNRNDYDIVFVHMNYEYVNLGGIFWRLLGKKVGLWYAHGYAPIGLKTAEKLVHAIFTSTKSGCRINSHKINVIGQGIDVEKFKSLKPAGKPRNEIISIGRISPSKDYGTLISAVEVLKNKGVKIKVRIIGGPATESDKNYFNELSRTVDEKKLRDEIEFVGPVANREILKFLQSAALFVNMGQTGSLDKAMVEAMSAELPVLSCNEAMLEVFSDYKNELMYPKKDYKKLAEKIEYIINLPDEQYLKMGENLRRLVIDNHSLTKFINKILNLY